ncbi:hypothetical protein ACOMHN_037038 [Nucella lapillus]
MYRSGNTLRSSQSMADLTSETQLPAPPPPRQRSGSSAGLLDLPHYFHPEISAPKRFSSPNIALLASRINQAELSKLQRFSGGERELAFNRNPSPRASQDWGSGRDSHGSLSAVKSPYVSVARENGFPQNNAYIPAADYGEGGGMSERSPASGRESVRSSTHSSVSSGLNIYIGPPESGFPEEERLRTSSLHDDGSFQKGHLSGGVEKRPVQAIPSLPELKAAKKKLRPGQHEDRRSSLSPSHDGTGERSPRHSSRTPSPTAEGAGRYFGSENQSSTPIPPPLPAARPSRLLAKRFSVPDVLDGGDFQQELASSDMFRRRMTSADITMQAYAHDNNNVINMAAWGFSKRPDVSGGSVPPPPLPTHPPPVDKMSPMKSSSLRRKALEALSLSNSLGSDYSTDSTATVSTNATTTTKTMPSNATTNSVPPVPAINITNFEDLGPFSPDMDYPENDLSPTGAPTDHLPHPHITSPGSQLSGDSGHIYKSVSEVTSSTYDGSGGSQAELGGEGGKEDTQSNNTDSGLGEGEGAKEDLATWRPYDVFQLSERETDDDGAVFREILKVLRLILYFFIIVTVLTGTIASRLSLLLFTAGISQDKTSRAESSVMLLFCICCPIAINWFLAFARILFSGKQWPTVATLLSYPVIQYPIIQYPIIQYPVIQYPVIQYPVIQYPVIQYPIIQYPIIQYPVIHYPVIQYPIIQYPIIQYPIIQYPIIHTPSFVIQYPIIQYPIIQYPIIQYPIIQYPLLLQLLTIELLQTFGICLMLFRILPVLDFIRGITVTMATFQLPALLKLLFTERKKSSGAWSCLHLVSSMLALATQVAAIVFFLVTPFSDDGIRETIPAGKEPRDIPHLSELIWELPVSLVLISLSSWENFLSGQWSMSGKVSVTLKRGRQVAQEVRDTSTFLIAPFKIGLSIALGKYLTGTTFLLPGHSLESSSSSSSSSSNSSSSSSSSHSYTHIDYYSLLYLQLGASILVTYLASLACKLHMQKTAFAFPLLLSPLASLGIVYLQCRYSILPGDWHMGVWVCPSVDLGDLMLPLACVGALWISYCLVMSHVWFPRSERMAKVEKLFVTPHFDAIFPDFHLTSRRRRNDLELQTHLGSTQGGEIPGCPYAEPQGSTRGSTQDDNVTPMVFVCATMWHETQREMTQLLKSLFRLDYVHCASKLAQDKFDIKDPDYYDLEIHVLFDDSFELDDEADRYVPNMFVRQFIECMEDAARSVLKGPIVIPPPVKSPTPYGGLLVWTMPGQTRMFVHLKNKNLIRHRKRWSQCMYLYYLLGFRLLGGKGDTLSDNMSDCDSDQKHASVRHRGGKSKVKAKTKRGKKRAIPLRSLLGHMPPGKYEQTIQKSENTFILTLDGDVDFRPDSVRLLLDRMKKNKKVGAVCGRIHPIGSGPMVWYQQFEYAVGHWLQKASEHVFGCVLCCPGCFSLFRGSALMDDNVVKRYTTKPTEAAHFIQFEQGEDRWLCTLLLQQGHRIDYSAGADALTFAPETFNEFFNQRRRWSPSTHANMMDLLSSWRETVRMNDNISRLYILYQFLLMASSILAPSTVILMITGSYHSVLGLSMWWSFVLSLAPVLFYLAVCLTQKNDLQIKIGAVLTALYTVVMMVATVGTLISIATESFNSPNVVFLTGLFIIFFVASLLHPQEFFCLVYGALYFLVIPSTFILLTIFYLCNLNNVSWGTREMPKKLTPDELEAQKLAAEEKVKKSRQSLFSLYGVVSLVHELREAIRGLWGLRAELKQTDGDLTSHPEQRDVEKAMHVQPKVAAPPPPPPPPPTRAHPVGFEPNPENPYWLGLDYLGNGMVQSLVEEEKEFWKFIIRKYLYPLYEDKSQKAKIAEDLIIIRNNVVFIYVMMNFLWCVIALQLQSMEGSLKMFYIVQKYEPLSLAFLSLFAMVLLLQFLSMLVHRWGTFLHLMASTRIDWCKKSFSEEEFARYVVNQTKILQNLEPSPDYEDGSGEGSEEEEEEEGGGMSLRDLHPSLYDDRGLPTAAAAGAVQDVKLQDQAGIYETLRHHHPGQYVPRYPYPPYPGTADHQQRTAAAAYTRSGQFPMLKTIFEQKLTQLQQRYQQRGSVSRQQGRTVARFGTTQRRYWGDRSGDMRQRFVHQNFQMPPSRGARLFRGEHGVDIV